MINNIHPVVASLRQSLGSTVVPEFDRVTAAICEMSEDGISLLQGTYSDCPLKINKAIVIALSRKIPDRAELERAVELVELILAALEENGLIGKRKRKILIGKAFPNQLVSLEKPYSPDVLEDINALFRYSSSASELSDEAVAGGALILLVGRCGVVTKAGLRAALTALRSPISAVNNWWWVDLHHKQLNGAPLELRRVFLPVEVAAYLMRFHIKICAAIDRSVGSQDVIVDRLIKAFQIENGIGQPHSTRVIISAFRHQYLLQLPGFLYGYVSRNVESHSLSESQWLRMNGVFANYGEEADSGPAYAEWVQSASERPFDDRRLKPLLAVCENQSALVEFTNSSDLVLKFLASWVIEVQATSLRERLLRVIYPWVAEALDGLEGPVDVPTVETLRDLSLSLAAAEGAAILELCRDFWDFLVAQFDPQNKSDKQKGVRPNALSPAEWSVLREFLDSGQTGILDDSLRKTVSLFLKTASATGARRAEALFLRTKDFQGEESLSVIIEEHDARSLKTSASKRIIPSSLISHDLAMSLKNIKDGIHPDDLPLRHHRVAGLRKAETIYQRSSDILARLFGNGFTIHHLRHTLATSATVQLHSEVLDLKAFRGRCQILDDLLEEAPLTLSILGANNTSRRGIWAVSSLLGHVDPRVTMKSYIHCFDWLTFFAIKRWSEVGYVDELSALSGLPYDTVKKHFYSCPPDGYSLLGRMEKDFPGGVVRHFPKVNDSASGSDSFSVSILRDVEHEASLSVDDTERTLWPQLVGPKAEAEAEAICRIFSLGLKNDEEATLSALSLMNGKIHRNGFFSLAPGEERKIFRSGMLACGLTTEFLELSLEKNGKFSGFKPFEHWSALTRSSANAWVRFAPLSSKTRSAVALRWVLHWAQFLVERRK